MAIDPSITNSFLDSCAFDPKYAPEDKASLELFELYERGKVLLQIAHWVFRLLAWLARRPVLKIRIVEDEPERRVGGLVFEVENASPTVTSLVPTVRSRFWFRQKGRYHKGNADYDIWELDRELPPFKAKMLSASARSLPPGHGHSLFRVYDFQPRRGPRTRVRIRNAALEPLDTLRFTFELWRFRLKGQVQRATPGTLADWRARQRSRGPH